MPPNLSAILVLPSRIWITHRLGMTVHVETLALHIRLNDFVSFIIHGDAKDHQPLGAILLVELDQPGYLVRHGAHQVAQKFTRTTFPLY